MANGANGHKPNGYRNNGDKPKRKRNSPNTPPSKRKPTEKERKLIAGVLAGKSRARAARDAGYSPKSAAVIAYETLTKPHIQARVERRLAELDVTADEIIKGLAFQARADHTELYDEEGRFDLARVRALGLGPLIKRLKTKTKRYTERQGSKAVPVEEQEVDVESYSSFSAYTQLSKILGIEHAPLESKVEEERAKRFLIHTLRRTIEEAGSAGEKVRIEEVWAEIQATEAELYGNDVAPLRDDVLRAVGGEKAAQRLVSD